MKKLDIKNYKEYPGGIIIHKNADIAEDVEIGFGCVIHNDVIIKQGCKLDERIIIQPHVEIDKNCTIHENVAIGYNYRDGFSTYIGEDSIIRRGCSIYAGSTFGKGFQTGVAAVIREKCDFGEYCNVGTLCQFEGYAKIGKYSRFQTTAHVGQASNIGRYVWIFPFTCLTNDKYPPHDICPPYNEHKGPNVKDFAIIATSCTIMPNVTIGKDSLIAAHSNVTKDVPDGELWMGNPAKFKKRVEDIIWDDEYSKLIGFERPYPWRKSLKRENYFIDSSI